MKYNHFYSSVYELTAQFAKIHSLKICFSVISYNNYVKSAHTSVKALFFHIYLRKDCLIQTD